MSFLSSVITVGAVCTGIVGNGIAAAGRAIGFCAFVFTSNTNMHFSVMDHSFHKDSPFLFSDLFASDRIAAVVCAACNSAAGIGVVCFTHADPPPFYLLFSNGLTVLYLLILKNLIIFLRSFSSLKHLVDFSEIIFLSALSEIKDRVILGKEQCIMCDKMTFKALDKDGKEVLCEVLLTFTSDITGKDYMVYTDNAVDENGNTKVYASIYDPADPVSDLIPIENEWEWRLVQHILQEIQEEYPLNRRLRYNPVLRSLHYFRQMAKVKR